MVKLRLFTSTMMTLLFIINGTAQQNVEIDDGKLIVKRAGSTAEIEISTTNTVSDAQIQFGDNGVASDATIGWDNSEDELRITPGSTLANSGINISGVGSASRIGLGISPDPDAKVLIRFNSLTTRPHLHLQENNSADAARLRFGQFSVNDYWQLEGFGGTSPFFKFVFDDGLQNDILTLEGNTNNVIVEDGQLEVKRVGGFTSTVAVSTGGSNSDANIKFGDDGNANDVSMGWDGGDEMLKISVGNVLDNLGLTMEDDSGIKFGFGSQPDANAKVLINHNSTAGPSSSAQLLLQENNNDDFARLQFGNFGATEYWHVAARTEDDLAGSDPRINFYYHNGSSGKNIFILDGDDETVGVKRKATGNDFEVEGSASKMTAGDWLANSDRRIKTDIQDIKDPYTTMLKLRPVTFRYTDSWKEKHPSIEDKVYYNFIAQEYQEVFPESAQGSGEFLGDDNAEVLQIDTYNAQIVNMAATQQLIRENAIMKKELEELKSLVEILLKERQELTASAGK